MCNAHLCTVYHASGCIIIPYVSVHSNFVILDMHVLCRLHNSIQYIMVYYYSNGQLTIYILEAMVQTVIIAMGV